MVGTHGVGSNNWVVAPSLTTTGGALLANDPHLGISMPSIWFLNGLHCAPVTDACPYDVAGASFPGVPAVALGHNARIAWGATNAGTDAQDLFIEQADPADPTRYLFEGESRPFETRTEEIRVKGASEPVLQEVRLTAHGPILNDVEKRLADAPLMSLNWTAIAETDRTFEAILGLNTADSFEEFRRASRCTARRARTSSTQTSTATSATSCPARSRSATATQPACGRAPATTARTNGRAASRSTSCPSLLDPEAGTIVTANNAIVDSSYPYYLADHWDPGFRAERAADGLLERSEDGLTLDDMTELQMDTAMGRARNAAIWLMAAEPATDDGRIVLDRILDWDGACDIDSLGCAAWSMFEYRLHRDVFDDDLGPLARDYVGTPPAQMLIDALFDDPEATWWDDVSTPNRETSAEIVGARPR